ncbi:helix-turn-helix transcriptional regulator [Streptococcus suis]|uniref:helix-turn-helix transcriptional regulator n=1 Tax=Streptococcus suis TaxID=1307 RepID=UPI002A791D24|nr:helix-turn-helix transcriptional regulator [Streptococcus suis]HEL2599690.1 helix-turn-helix transcriptional regulator [Streptococcus suis]
METKNRLKSLRLTEGLSQVEFYNKVIKDELGLNVTLRTYQNWEKPENEIKSKPAQMLADHFGVSVGYLLGYDTDSGLLDTLSRKISHMSPEEFVEYTKTTNYSIERELFEFLFEKSQEIDEQTSRGRKIKDILGLLKGLDLDDLNLINGFVERLYFSEYSLEDDEKLDNKREQLRKELEQSET